MGKGLIQRLPQYLREPYLLLSVDGEHEFVVGVETDVLFFIHVVAEKLHAVAIGLFDTEAHFLLAGCYK